jgi:hypothetical protein
MAQIIASSRGVGPWDDEGNSLVTATLSRGLTQNGDTL